MIPCTFVLTEHRISVVLCALWSLTVVGGLSDKLCSYFFLHSSTTWRYALFILNKGHPVLLEVCLPARSSSHAALLLFPVKHSLSNHGDLSSQRHNTDFMHCGTDRISHYTEYRFSSRWYLRARNSPFLTSSPASSLKHFHWVLVWLTMVLSRPFKGDRQSNAFSFHASLSQAIDGVMSLVLCPQVGS